MRRLFDKLLSLPLILLRQGAAGSFGMDAVATPLLNEHVSPNLNKIFI